jgi:hypothetical protein
VGYRTKPFPSVWVRWSRDMLLVHMGVGPYLLKQVHVPTVFSNSWRNILVDFAK